MKQEAKIILSFDIEEFDLPTEFGIKMTTEKQIQITDDGLQKLFMMLEKKNITSTLFVTSIYALENKSLVNRLSRKNEIASHSFRHGRFAREDYEKSKKILEEITGMRIKGFRMPRFENTNYEDLKKCGYDYDSSINPTWMPGRYNNFSKPRLVYSEGKSGLAVVPLSVSPKIRFPLSWLVFKNLPFAFYCYLVEQTLRHDKYIHLYFHPWEFSDIGSFKIPKYIKQPDGEILLSKFERLIDFLATRGKFVTISEFLDSAASR